MNIYTLLMIRNVDKKYRKGMLYMIHNHLMYCLFS